MINADQMRAAMAMHQWTDRHLAERTGMHVNTIARIRKGAAAEIGTWSLIETTLAVDGVEFVPAEKGGPGVRRRAG
jgi:transcriptional regulator with XRE-family HTH domain